MLLYQRIHDQDRHGFWLGLMGIEIFSVRLGLLPTAGLENWRGYILPSLVMGTGIMAVLARYSRSSMLETLSFASPVIAQLLNISFRSV